MLSGVGSGVTTGVGSGVMTGSSDGVGVGSGVVDGAGAAVPTGASGEGWGDPACPPELSGGWETEGEEAGVAEGVNSGEGVGVGVITSKLGEACPVRDGDSNGAGSPTVVLASLTAIAVQLNPISAGAGLFNTIVNPSKLLLLTK